MTPVAASESINRRTGASSTGFNVHIATDTCRHGEATHTITVDVALCIYRAAGGKLSRDLGHLTYSRCANITPNGRSIRAPHAGRGRSRDYLNRWQGQGNEME
jgi:hypothetical protein